MKILGSDSLIEHLDETGEDASQHIAVASTRECRERELLEEEFRNSCGPDDVLLSKDYIASRLNITRDAARSLRRRWIIAYCPDHPQVVAYRANQPSQRGRRPTQHESLWCVMSSDGVLHSIWAGELDALRIAVKSGLKVAKIPLGEDGIQLLKERAW